MLPSPGRVLIHAMDPVILCAEVAYTPLQERVNARTRCSLLLPGRREWEDMILWEKDAEDIR